MTPREELLKHLRKDRGDEEIDHNLAEDLLCDWLRSIGEDEIATAWENAQRVQNWWYA